MNRRLLLLVTLFTLSVVSLAPAGFDEGQAAYLRGDYATAYREFMPLAEQGDVGAQVKLGMIYSIDPGGLKDYTEAAKWYRKAAEQGIAEAQYELGLMYANGQGVPQDNTEAVTWYRKAAEQGRADAQARLGAAYVMGKGVHHDYAEAVKWYRKAAEQGFAMAEYGLGLMYANGQGVPQDNTEAVKWYRKAAEQGNKEAQTSLRNLSSTSTPVPNKEIPLKKRGSVYELPVRINGVIVLNFILDSGASEVTIPADVALTLLRAGTISQSDFLPGQSYRLADGSISKGSRFIIRELEIGGIKISQVPATVMPATAPLLLGQSFLARLASWSLDNKRHVLIIGGFR